MGLLAAHLTPENHRDLLDIARHTSKRQVEELVARLRPQPTGDAQGVASPPLSSAAPAPPPSRRGVVAPLAPQRDKVQFTASADTYEKLTLAQALLRHQIPDGDLGTIVDRALTALVQDLARQTFAATDRPRRGRGTSRPR